MEGPIAYLNKKHTYDTPAVFSTLRAALLLFGIIYSRSRRGICKGDICSRASSVRTTTEVRVYADVANHYTGIMYIVVS